MPDTMFRPENISRTVLTTCSSMSSKRASPPVSIVMAVVFLGESFETYHALGIVLVTGGVVLATAPIGRR